MGVTALWEILDDLPKVDIKTLRGKRVAVDISGWIVQADKEEEKKDKSQRENDPYIRFLFNKVVNDILLYGLYPIFVLEGKPPKIKKKLKDGKRKFFEDKQMKCRVFLKSLGFPCVNSSGEAEALCAQLCHDGIVDAVMTSDNDAFVYGAHTVIRIYTAERKDGATTGDSDASMIEAHAGSLQAKRHLRVYSLEPSEPSGENLNLNRHNLVTLALLLGCDYCDGVYGIGKVKAVDFIKDLKGGDPLERFEEWKKKSRSACFPGYVADMKKESHCTDCSHLGSSRKHKKEGCKMCKREKTCYPTDPNNPCNCAWHKNNDFREKHKNEIEVHTAALFPDARVIKEYLEFKDEIPKEKDLDWHCRDLNQFQVEANKYFKWDPSVCDDKCFPIIKSWQQFKLSEGKNIELLYKPEVLEEDGEDCLTVQWTYIDSSSSGNKKNPTEKIQEKNQTKEIKEEKKTKEIKEKKKTKEIKDEFIKSYPEIFKKFDNSRERPKSTPQKSKSEGEYSGRNTKKQKTSID